MTAQVQFDTESLGGKIRRKKTGKSLEDEK